MRWIGPLLLTLCCNLACGDDAADTPEPRVIEAADYDCRAAGAPLQRRPGARPECFTDAACAGPLVVGHRGMGGNFAPWVPENTLSAVRLAILLGLDAVEIDVRHTADGQLVVVHDSTLDRTTRVDGAVEAKTAAELSAVAIDVDGYPGELGCERVPRLEELFELARGRIFLVADTKTDRADLLARAIRDADLLDGVIIGISDPDGAALARQTVPEVAVQIRPDTLDEYEDFAGRLDRPAEVVEVPESLLEDAGAKADADGSKLFTNLFSRDIVVFGDGDLSHYAAPLDAGADVVQTEFPSWVLEHLGRRDWASLPAPRDLGLDSPRL